MSIGAPRLRATGLNVREPLPDAELSLDELLRREYGDDAHGRYNALVRRFVSYERVRPADR